MLTGLIATAVALIWWKTEQTKRMAAENARIAATLTVPQLSRHPRAPIELRIETCRQLTSDSYRDDTGTVPA